MPAERRLLVGGPDGPGPDLAERLSRRAAAGLHLGSETCARLLPSNETLRQVLDVAVSSGWPFALVTPAMVPEAALARVQSLLGLLPDGTEVVANDWGVVRLLARRHPRLEPVLGRMLCGLRPDPRVPSIARDIMGPDGATALLADLAGPPVARESAVRLLLDLGVRRIELNPVAQGLPPEPPRGLRVTLHQPFAIVSATRYCPQQRLAMPRPPLLVRSCTQECRTRAPVRLAHEQFPVPLYVSANALLAPAEPPADPPDWIDRIVITDLDVAGLRHG